MAITSTSLSPPATRRPVEVLRQIHRWIALVLALFVMVIGVTGTILQTIMRIYGDSGPFQAPGEPGWVFRLRDLAVTIHTWAFFGEPGVYLSMICGLGVLFFSISGVWMYWQLYRSRAALGRKTLFWTTRLGSDAAMRSLHRWCTLGIVLFTILLSVTAIDLDLIFARDNVVPLPPPRGGGAGAPGGPRLPAGPGGWWHQDNLALHKLNFLGPFGHPVGILVGLGLTTMAISGIWMYFSMLIRRHAAGLKGWLW